MAGICDPFVRKSDATYTLCKEGKERFEQLLDPIIVTKQSIGKARVNKDTASQVQALQLVLRGQAEHVEQEYARQKALCDKEQVSACGFVHQHNYFVRMHGPLGAVVRDAPSPSSVPLRPLRSGYLIGNPSGSTTYEVLFDTGAPIDIFSAAFAQSNASSFREFSPGEKTGLSLYQVSGFLFRFGSVEYEPGAANISPVVDFLGGSDRNHSLIAIFGLHFLMMRPFEVNYDTATLTLDVDVTKRLAEGRWEALPTRGVTKDHALIVDVTLNGVSFPMVVDTGTNTTSLSPECASRFSDLPQERATTGIVHTVAGKHKEIEMSGVNAILGSTTTRIAVGVGNAGFPFSPILTEEGACGLLGLDVLRYYNILVDPVTFVVYVSRRETDDVVPVRRSVGFSPSWREGVIIVEEVTAAGPAERAGLRKGDVIMEVDGQSSAGLTALQLLEKRYGESDSMVLVVERGTKHKVKKKIKIALKKS